MLIVDVCVCVRVMCVCLCTQVGQLKKLLPGPSPDANGHMDTDEDDHHEIPAGMSVVSEVYTVSALLAAPLPCVG